MDPISVIIAALVAGASAALKETAGTAVKDAYAGLKRLIRRHLGSKPEAEAEFEQLERRPDADQTALAERLRASGADGDEDLVRAAQVLLEQVDPAGARAGKYDVRITGGKGIVVGDNAAVTMNFDDDDQHA